MVTRRGFLAGVGAATLVFGFDPVTRSWISEAQAAPFHQVPRLDGQLLTDLASRTAIGQDVGGIIFSTPAAVLKPGSVDDVIAMIRFCNKHRIKVAARGQGHSTHGQSQVDAGLAIDMSTLNRVRKVRNGYAIVQAGSTWRNLLETTLTTGQTPPVLTGFIGLTIGGTLSMGGISGMAYNKGVQVEHVLELEVVTGCGDLERCSRHHNRELFDAVLAGVGQCAIIVEAKVQLEPAEARARDLTLRYNDLHAFLEDVRTLVDREEFDMVWGGFKRDSSGWFYELYTTSFYTAPNVPDIEYLTRELSFEPGSMVEIDGTYLEYQTRVDGIIELLKAIGAWNGVMHPWFDCFLPDSTFEDYLNEVLPTLAPDDVGNFGFVLMFPLFTSTIHRPSFRLPNDDLVFLFDINNAANAPGFDEEFAARMRARNRALFEAARDVGGVRYPIGTLDFTQEDWRRHYGREWRRVVAAKHRFDPRNILTPGPGIFPG